MFKLYAIYAVLLMIVISILYGLRQYLQPEKVVSKRYKKHHKLAQETGDKEFQHWLQREFNSQVKRTKRVGLMLTSFETVFLLIVIYYLTRFKH